MPLEYILLKYIRKNCSKKLMKHYNENKLSKRTLLALEQCFKFEFLILWWKMQKFCKPLMS